MSLQLFLIDKMLRFSVKRRFAKAPGVMTLRAVMEEMARQAKPPKPPVTLENTALGGRPCEKLTVPGADAERAMLYIHGGGFVAGVPANHRALTSYLAKAMRMPVYAVDYRLAPEHPFPAGLEDCVAAYAELLARGHAARHIAIAGDSAGGNLVLATALKLKQDGTELPGCLVALSPVTDLKDSAPSHRENARKDALFVGDTFGTVAAAYCPDRDPADPLISPWRGDVAGLPPTLFQCSRDEMLRDDAVRMADKMKAAGVAVEIEVWPKVPHVWQVLADLLPEARQAAGKIAAFVVDRLK